jgi:hypothetical protein
MIPFHRRENNDPYGYIKSIEEMIIEFRKKDASSAEYLTDLKLQES